MAAGGEGPHHLIDVGDVDVVFDQQDLGYTKSGLAREHDLADLITRSVNSQLTMGPILATRNRVLRVGRTHRLATRASVSIEELAGKRTHVPQRSVPTSLYEVLNPSVRPSGRLIPVGAHSAPSVQEAMAFIAQGRTVHPTFEGVTFARRDDIVAVPLEDLVNDG